jgi:hypothetical protein
MRRERKKERRKKKEERRKNGRGFAGHCCSVMGLGKERCSAV